jgi:hypothetical protein
MTKADIDEDEMRYAWECEREQRMLCEGITADEADRAMMEEAALHLERKGILEKVRDADGMS